MSLTNNLTYPYTFKDKFYYYCGKTYCFGAKLVGASIYARFLWRQPYLTDRAVYRQNRENLTQLIDITCGKRLWHFKNLFINIFVGAPMVLGSVYYKYLTPKQGMFALGGIGFFSINNIYGIFAHCYNNIRFKHQLYRLQSSTPQKSIDDIDVVQPAPDTMIPPTDLEDKIGKEKCSWFLFSYETKENGTAYVVHNAYHQNLVFIFQVEKTANEFMAELKTLESDRIDYLANNADSALKLQQQFISSKVYAGLYYNYYTNNIRL